MMPSLLCETVTGASMAELLAARDAVDAADMVELRLDGVRDVNVAGALAGRRLPAVVTCRAPWEGGRFDGTEEERRTLLGHALDAGAEFVDVEWKALSDAQGPQFTEMVRRAHPRVVLSNHEFSGMPADLRDRAGAMRGTGVGVIKIAAAAATLTETLPLREIARGGNAVVIGMGEAGVPSRLLASRYGSKWTYSGNGVAPGQLPASRMTGEFRFRAIGPQTRLFGVISTNAMHSLSPVMHNAAFDAAGLDAVYVPLRAASFADFLTYADAMGIEGASVTIPFKLDALRAARNTDERTRAVGAANTLRRSGPTVVEAGAHVGAGFSRPAIWEATNTDVDGFLAPLEAMEFPLKGIRAAVLGAGGAARAVIVALKSHGATVTVFARRRTQVRDVATEFDVIPGGSDTPDAGSWDLLVNCTPLGGADRRDESPLPAGPFTGRMVCDLTYGRGASALIREARAAGCATLDGLPMLIAQAERQFEWWTGQAPLPGVMETAARRRIEA